MNDPATRRSGMSPVTAQGQRAQAAMNARIEEFRPLVLTRLRQADASPNQLVDHFHSEPAEVVREAMWQLIDNREVVLTPSLRLHAPEA